MKENFLFLITGKLILSEFPSNWLTIEGHKQQMRNLSVAGLIGLCSDQRNELENKMFEVLVVVKSNKDFSHIGCIVLCIIGVSDCDGTVQ